MNSKKDLGILLMIIAAGIAWVGGSAQNITEIKWFSGGRYMLYQPYSVWFPLLFILEIGCGVIGWTLIDQAIKEAKP